MYTIRFSLGKNWLRYSTHCVYSSSSFDSRGTGSRFLTRLRIVIGAPYRRNRSSKCLEAAVKNGSTTLTVKINESYKSQKNGQTFDRWFRCHAICFLDPRHRNTSAILNIARIVRVRASTVLRFIPRGPRRRIIKGCRQCLADNLLRFNLVCYVALNKAQLIF